MKKLLVLGAVLALVPCFGCGNSEEQAVEEPAAQAVESSPEKDAGVGISEEGLEITSKDEDGTYTYQAGDKAEIPENFPDDVFIYEGSELLMISESPQGWVLTLRTDAPRDDVIASYEKEMSAAGWAEITSTNMDGDRMLIYGQGDRTVNVGIFAEEGVTQVSLSVSG